MNAPTIIIAALIAAIFVAIVVVRIRNRKKGKGGCSCGCSGCGMSDICHGANEKK